MGDFGLVRPGVDNGDQTRPLMCHPIVTRGEPGESPATVVAEWLDLADNTTMDAGAEQPTWRQSRWTW